MLLSSIGFHPGVQSNSKVPRRPMKKFSRSFMKPSPTPSPPQSPNTKTTKPSRCCDLWLLSTLQGCSSSTSDRQCIAKDIEQMTNQEKDDLIDFLHGKNGAITSAIENNACKQFVCSPSDLSSKLLTSNTSTLLEMWSKLYQETIPALQSTLYPLKRHRASFDIRKSVLIAFRDRVLVKLLKDCCKVVSIEAMLFTLLLETQDDSKEYTLFSELANRVMKGDEPTNDSRILVKSRSKTLPNKSSKTVTWQDMRKSATFSH